MIDWFTLGLVVFGAFCAYAGMFLGSFIANRWM